MAGRDLPGKRAGQIGQLRRGAVALGDEQLARRATRCRPRGRRRRSPPRSRRRSSSRPCRRRRPRRRARRTRGRSRSGRRSPAGSRRRARSPPTGRRWGSRRAGRRARRGSPPGRSARAWPGPGRSGSASRAPCPARLREWLSWTQSTPGSTSARNVSAKNPRASPNFRGASRTGPSRRVGTVSMTAKEARGRRRRNPSPMKRTLTPPSAGPTDGHQTPLRLHPGSLRRLLALPEGRRPVHRRPPRRGRLPDRRGARPPREHLELDRRALLPGARLRGLPGAPGLGARGVPPPLGRAARRPGERHAAVLARPHGVRGCARRRPRQRRGDRAQAVPPRRRGRDRRDRRRGEDPDRGHRPDGVLRLLPAPPADAARPPGRDRRQPVAGGAGPPGPDRRARRSSSACPPAGRIR